MVRFITSINIKIFVMLAIVEAMMLEASFYSEHCRKEGYTLTNVDDGCCTDEVIDGDLVILDTFVGSVTDTHFPNLKRITGSVRVIHCPQLEAISLTKLESN